MDSLINYLNFLGYPEDEELDVESLKNAVEGGCDSPYFTAIVAWLTQELQALCNMESCINRTEGPDDASSFIVEMKTFLKELDCPIQCLFEDRHKFTENDWQILLDYLISAIMGNRMIKTDHPDALKEMKVQVAESDVAKDLREMLQKLHLSKPPEDLKPVQLFTKLDSKLNEYSEKNSGVLLQPAFSGTLTEKQWILVDELQRSLHEEYKRRREMLTQRLDVTKESFLWGETGKKLSDKIKSVYDEKMVLVSRNPSVEVSDLLSARDDSFVVEKTSGENVRGNTKSAINEVVIGPVPDRGGRPEDQMPPPPEVPSWQKNEPVKTGARPKTADNFSSGPSGVRAISGPSGMRATHGPSSMRSAASSSVRASTGPSDIDFGSVRERSWHSQPPQNIHHLPVRVEQDQYLLNFPTSAHQHSVYTLPHGTSGDMPPLFHVPLHFVQQQPRRRPRGRFVGNQGARGNRRGRGNRGPRFA